MERLTLILIIYVFLLTIIGIIIVKNNTISNNNYACVNGVCSQVDSCNDILCTSKEYCNKNCNILPPSPRSSPGPSPLLKPYKNGTLDKCLSQKSVNNYLSTGCVDCDKLDGGIGDRQIYCDVSKTPGFVCNRVFQSFFDSLGLNGFDYLQSGGQYYNGLNMGALQVAGKNYKNYKDYKTFDMVDRTMDLKVIKTVLDLVAPNDDEKISVFLVQAPLSFINVPTKEIIAMLRSYESTNPLVNKSIESLIKMIQNDSINKGKITGEDLGLYHSGLVFIKTSDFKLGDKFPADKIIASLELWGNVNTGASLWGSTLPTVNKNGQINIKNITNNIIVSTIPQVFGCTAKDFYGDYWNVQDYLGETDKSVIVQLFGESQKWLKENTLYIAQAITSNYIYNCNGSKSSYIRSITCETFAIDMIKKLITLDPKNFNNNVFERLKFSEVAFVGNYEILNELTENQITDINTYSQNVEKYITTLPNYDDNEFMASPVTPSQIPLIGNLLNKLLALGTATIIQQIAKETDTMYVVVMNKNVPKICKVTSISWMEPLKIDILYSECPAKI